MKYFTELVSVNNNVSDDKCSPHSLLSVWRASDWATVVNW